MGSAVIDYTSGVSKSGAPFCQIAWGKEQGQMTPNEVRAFAMQLFECAEAAEMDAMVFAWAQEMGLGEQERAHMLYSFREFRNKARRISGDEPE